MRRGPGLIGRVVAGAVVCAVGSGTLVGCGLGTPPRQQVEWILVSEEGASLDLGVYAGGSTCTDADGIEVEEGARRVEVRAFVQRTRGACSEDFGVRLTTVELEEPLGDRTLVGCAGDAVQVKGWGLDPDTDCAEKKPGLVPGTIDVPVG
ncbi:hypothetical protein DLJ96_17750 [Actinotalea fermentans ATCC 43279 = JCM 9966 = DSM 3133]|nr:hypothetical protein DLJ96_17750 [Actinotalea fermentans ATCC 43279 = JCM 9966 = DSM 3133]